MGLTGDAAANFVETMNTWNASVAASEDAEFGRSNGTAYNGLRRGRQNA